MSYCPGDNCSKREQCQKYYNEGQIIDWSNYGHGFGGIDKNGKSFNYHEIECGDNGTYGYKHFEECNNYSKPIKYKMTDKRLDCPMRHENGNCLPCGGFCTANNDIICEAMHNAYHIGLCNGLELGKNKMVENKK